MCLYPKLIRNKKYLPTKKNNYNPPKMADPRTAYITASCGKCLECRKQKQREWLVRMSEELRTEPNAYFMTLTISDENYQILKKYMQIRRRQHNSNKGYTSHVRTYPKKKQGNL